MGGVRRTDNHLSTTNPYVNSCIYIYISTEKGGTQFQGCQKTKDIKKRQTNKKPERTQCTYNNDVLKIAVGVL